MSKIEQVLNQRRSFLLRQIHWWPADIKFWNIWILQLSAMPYELWICIPRKKYVSSTHWWIIVFVNFAFQFFIQVCIKIIKNNKDYVDQSLDEIKLLQYLNSMGDPHKYNILQLYGMNHVYNFVLTLF